MQAEPVRVYIAADQPLVRDGLRLQLGDEIADLRVVLFIRSFRRGRGDEFLEARIIPERIEHFGSGQAVRYPEVTQWPCVIRATPILLLFF